jgi:putative radical SAM enzyme (TIGR03279 family)
MSLEHIVKEVIPGSIAQEMEIVPGDVLLAINDKEIEDVFDYRYLLKDEYIEVLVRKPDGEEWLLEIEKDYDDDLGIEFENGLMSEYRSCSNKCIFCFIDQMPPGMRETLYFKDDDSRLSFLQGNYITLTNMTEKDVERIIQMQLAPINISVQTTNPELRCRMLHNRFAGEKLQFLQRFYEGHVEMNGQIVCCKGVNDGEELRRSITDLMAYLPFMRSVSVVPAGISRFREGLYPIEMFTKEEAEQIVDMIESYQQACFEQYGLHFIHASDEFYILAGRKFPEEERYDGYIQLENGVGMMRLLMEEFASAWEAASGSSRFQELRQTLQRTVTVATGQLACSTLEVFAGQLMDAYPGLMIRVCAIRNDFFGETITVSGLVTGQDLIAQLQERQKAGEDLGEALLIPVNMLRSGEQVFLDDVTVAEVEKALGLRVVPVEAGGQDFVDAVLDREYCMERENEQFVYVRGYDR